MLFSAQISRIVRYPSACPNMRIFSSVVRRLPFIRLTPLAKVLRLTLFIDPFSEAQPAFTGQSPIADAVLYALVFRTARVLALALRLKYSGEHCGCRVQERVDGDEEARRRQED